MARGWVFPFMNRSPHKSYRGTPLSINPERERTPFPIGKGVRALICPMPQKYSAYQNR